MRRSTLLLLALLLAPLSEVCAQHIQHIPLAPNQRVRISIAAQRDVFLVDSVAVDTLVLRHPRRGEEVRVPYAQIERLDVSRGYSAPIENALKYGGLGLLVGAATGAALGYSSGDDPPEVFFHWTAEAKAVLLGFVFGMTGAQVGAVIGLFVETERWQRVLPPVRAGVAPASAGGVTLVVSRPL